MIASTQEKRLRSYIFQNEIQLGTELWLRVEGNELDNFRIKKGDRAHTGAMSLVVIF